MTEMAMGANVQIAAQTLRAALWWMPGPDVPDVDASALLLGADGQVASDDDFVFYNQPSHPSDTVRYAGKSDVGGQQADVIELDLDRVPDSIARIVIAASADGGTFGQVPGLALQITDRISGAPVAVFRMSATVEQAFLGGEIYRHGDAWRFRVIGQGYSTGLAGLAADFGIQVDGPATEEPIAAPLAPPPAAPAGTPTPPEPLAAVGPPAPAPVAATPIAAPVEAAPAAPAPPAPLPAAPPPAAAPASVAPVPPVVPPPPAVPPPLAVPAPPAAQPLTAPPPPPAAPAALAAPPFVAPPAPLDYAAAPEPVAPVPPVAPPPPAVPPPLAVPAPPAAQHGAAPAGAPLTGASLPTPTGSHLNRNDRVAIVASDGRPIARLFAGLGWMSAPGSDVDLDASAIAFDDAGKRDKVVGRRSSQAYGGAIAHLGDSRTGSMTGDAEVIVLDLAGIPGNIGTIVIAINSFSGQRFTTIANAYLRLGDADTGQELARFNLTDTQPSTAVLMASIRRDPAVGWQLRAIGEFHDTRFAKNLVEFAARHALMP